VVHVQAKTDLLQVIRALRPPGGFARRLNGREQQGDQDADNGDDNQKLNEREACRPLASLAARTVVRGGVE
jgi:hypothetical protein